MRAKKLVLFVIILGLCSFSAQAQSTTFNNPDSIELIPADSLPMQGSVYSSDISVAGQIGTVGKATVTLKGFTQNFPSGIDILLVAPDGTNVTIMSDVGGAHDVTNPIDITLDDAALTSLPEDVALTAGTYKPTNLAIGNVDFWYSPAPAPSGNTTLSKFKGINPNGTWKLYVVNEDDGHGFITGWSLTLTTQFGTLPVTLESFTPFYSEARHSVLLKWTTANETNSHSFVVEASSNGSDWKALGNVNAAGTAIHRHTYQYQDNDPYQGKNYYRLKQVDLDGKTHYSNVVSVIAVLSQYQMNPVFRNPGSSFSGVYMNTTPREKFSLFLIDMSGKVLIKKQDIINNGSSYYLDLSNLNSGMYILKFFSGRQVATQKLLFTR